MRASAATLDISPLSQVPLGAAHVGGSSWQGVTEPIEANVLALWPDSDAPVLIVTLDLLYPGAALRRAVEAAAHLLDPSRILVAASHTHRAPMTVDAKPRLGIPDAHYMDWLVPQLTAAVTRVLATEDARAVSISAAEGIAKHSINRRRRKPVVVSRRPRLNAFVNAPNPRGSTDETLITVTARQQDGTPVAVLWNYACHPVGFPILNTVAAHYPHVVRQAVRRHFGNEGLPVLFLQGFSGNTRPNATARVHSVGRHLRRAITGPVFEDMTADAYHEWTGSLADVVLQTLSSQSDVPCGNLETLRHAKRGASFATPLEDDVTFHTVRIGPDISIVGTSAEVVAEYAPVVRGLAGSRFVLCAGCLDDTFGYVPTTQILAEGGYEAGLYCPAFNLSALNPRIEDAFMAGIRAVTSAAAQAI